MKSKKFLLTLLMLIVSTEVFAWGKTGHRIVGEIAQRNLSVEAKRGVENLLGVEDLSRVANWPDEMKSNPNYNHSHVWHYVSIPTGKTYFDQKRNPDGDIIEGLFRFEETLRDTKKTKKEKAEALKYMVHMLGDLHQPFHVGLADDRGGNFVRLRWFNKETNLHALWDEDIINFEELSYTEYATYLNHFTTLERSEFSKGTFLDWAYESQNLRNLTYDLGDSQKVGFNYHHKIKPTMELRLRQAGLRLASVLNKIFKNETLDKNYVELRNKIKANI